MSCPHERIEAALDRWQECHWYIHQIERHYHDPQPFRYSFNSFLRAAKEVPQILKMELQNEDRFHSVFKPKIDSLHGSQLLRMLAMRRDFIVHRGMLDVLSRGRAGTTEGRGMKIAIGFGVAPWESTQEAFERYVERCRNDDFFGLKFGPDCDSQPCIWREWRIEDFPETDLLDLAVEAWRLIGTVISEIVVALGGDVLDLSLPCRHNPERIRLKVFGREALDGKLSGTSTTSL